MKITPNRKFWIVLFSLFMFTSRYMSLEGSDNTRTSYFNEKWLDAIISIEIVDEKGNIQQKETPGNSGGPVVYVPSIKLGEDFTSLLINEQKLIGIIASYIPYQEVAISPQTGRPRVIFEENPGLSEVIPAKAIKDLISRDDFKKQEEKLNVKQQ